MILVFILCFIIAIIIVMIIFSKIEIKIHRLDISNIERKKKRWHFFCKENKKRGIQDNNNEFIETYLAEDTFNDAQKEFLIQCLEEGDSVQEMKTYASASLTPAMMQRLRQVRKKRRERP